MSRIDTVNALAPYIQGLGLSVAIGPGTSGTIKTNTTGFSPCVLPICTVVSLAKEIKSLTDIASVQSATQCTTVGGAQGGGARTSQYVVWGTDDTKALQAAFKAAVGPTEAHGRARTV